MKGEFYLDLCGNSGTATPETDVADFMTDRSKCEYLGSERSFQLFLFKTRLRYQIAGSTKRIKDKRCRIRITRTPDNSADTPKILSNKS